MKKRVGIFGGSFDPVHVGHIEAAHSFLESGLIDQLILLLTPEPPHKTDRKKTVYAHRLKMLEIVFKNHQNVIISNIEQSLPKPSYTLRTVEHLYENNPDTLFFLCLGGDSITSFHTWHRYTEILKRCTLLAVERPGFDKEKADQGVLEKTIFVDHKPLDVSSTYIRKNRSKQSDRLTDSVAEYIDQHNLYQNGE